MGINSMGLKEIKEGIGAMDGEWIEKARQRTAQLVMPTRALGSDCQRME